MISDRYPNKENFDVLSGTIIPRREVITVTSREKIYILMKHEDFGDHELYCVHRLVRVIRDVSETHVFKYSEEKE